MTATILLVDDEPDLEALVTQKFRREIRDGSLSFVFAHDGIEALARIASGPAFDLVLSVLAVHHLDEDGKRDLFTRVARLSDNFVLGDVVVPERPEDAAIEIDWEYDLPSSVPDQVTVPVG